MSKCGCRSVARILVAKMPDRFAMNIKAKEQCVCLAENFAEKMFGVVMTVLPTERK